MRRECRRHGDGGDGDDRFGYHVITAPLRPAVGVMPATNEGGIAAECVAAETAHRMARFAFDAGHLQTRSDVQRPSSHCEVAGVEHVAGTAGVGSRSCGHTPGRERHGELLPEGRPVMTNLTFGPGRLVASHPNLQRREGLATGGHRPRRAASRSMNAGVGAAAWKRVTAN